ncbi:hypothetical protein NQ095_07675 [Rossellomorea sp. SC111]|nr:hypothetical protein [Rossellomorea sp. SC111]MCR8848277.1 hypothetical protein [Rossellomorea sp. SC111]
MIKKLVMVAVLILGILTGVNAIHSNEAANDIFPPMSDDSGNL